MYMDHSQSICLPQYREKPFKFDVIIAPDDFIDLLFRNPCKQQRSLIQGKTKINKQNNLVSTA